MKQRFIKYILFLSTVLAFAACHDDSEPAIHNVKFNTQVVAADKETGVTLRVILDTDVDISSVEYVTLQISENSNMSNPNEIKGRVGVTKDTFYCVAPNLKQDTKYYCTYVVGNYLSSFTGPVGSFYIDKNFNLINVWSQVAPFAGGLRSGGVAFALKDKGYYGLGKSSSIDSDKYFNDLWQYDPIADKWTQLSDFPSTGLDMAVSFVIGETAYVSLGRYLDASLNGYNTTTYAYDVANDKWGQKAAFPGIGRTGSVSFVANGKGYVVGGYKEKETYTDEVWCYDPVTDSWSQKNKFPMALTGCYTFELKNIVYVGGGYNLKTKTANTNLYAYDAASDSWSVAQTDCESLIYSSGFSSGDRCYVAGGEGELGKESLFMMYDGNEWATLGSFGEIRKKSSSFVLNGSFYLICGENDVNDPQKGVLKYSIE